MTTKTPPAMLPAMGNTSPKAVASRLRALMADMELHRVQDLADLLIQERSAVSNWLNGYNLPPVPLMVRLIEKKPGVTLDWLYRGDAGAIPHNLAIRLIALETLGSVPESPKEPESAPSRGQVAARKRRQRVRQAT